MPHIPTARRVIIDQYTDGLITYLKETNTEGRWLGDLAYALTRLTLGTARAINGPLRWWMAVAIIGTLEAIKIETYKRVVSPYENKQAGINGDVPEYAQADADLGAETEVVIKPRGRFTDEVPFKEEA